MFKWFEQCGVTARLRVLGLLFVMGVLGTASLASVLKWTTLLGSATLIALSLWSLVEYMARDLQRKLQCLMAKASPKAPTFANDDANLSRDAVDDVGGELATALEASEVQAQEIRRLRMAGAI